MFRRLSLQFAVVGEKKVENLTEGVERKQWTKQLTFHASSKSTGNITYRFLRTARENECNFLVKGKRVHTLETGSLNDGSNFG